MSKRIVSGPEKMQVEWMRQNRLNLDGLCEAVCGKRLI